MVTLVVVVMLVNGREGVGGLSAVAEGAVTLVMVVCGVDLQVIGWGASVAQTAHTQARELSRGTIRGVVPRGKEAVCEAVPVRKQPSLETRQTCISRL